MRESASLRTRLRGGGSIKIARGNREKHGAGGGGSNAPEVDNLLADGLIARDDLTVARRGMSETGASRTNRMTRE